MPIPPVSLDDLTWADLTAAARQRIPAASRGRWTLHAPVDPGITLMELHAWLLEQRLYWMDQVPDALSRGALALLGEAPRDAASAITVLYFGASGRQQLPAGTAMQLQDSNPPLVFTTRKPVTLLPLAGVDATLPLSSPRIGAAVDGMERVDDLAAGRTVGVFRAPGDEIAITLWMTTALAAPAAADALSLLVLLDSPGGEVPAEWSADAVDGIGPPATLSWWYAAGTESSARVVHAGSGQ